MILTFRLWDLEQACTWRMDTPNSRQKRIRPPSPKLSWLFDELSDDDASDDGLSLAACVAVNEQISDEIDSTQGPAVFKTGAKT